MRATVKDVAALAGVSPKTVSNVINGVVFVRPDTRTRVESALAELDYVPNLSARGLRTGRTGSIALAFPDLSTPYSAEMTHWFVEQAHERGWSIQLEQTGSRPEREGELLSRGKEHLVDGLVLNPITLDASALSSAGSGSGTGTGTGTGAADSLPPVVVIGEVEQTLVDQVRVDSVAAARDMTAHLIAAGHRRIATLGDSAGEFDTATARARTRGFEQAMAEAGLPLDHALQYSCPEWTSADAFSVVRAAVERGDRPDAIFCFTDSLAIGAVSALTSAGLRVPDDVAVAGFDDIVDGRFSVPPLTTVTFDKRLFVDRTLELLAARIADRQGAAELVIVPHEIVVRASTRGRA
ncbi:MULTISPECIES: LacI family DNA-binding transcriptional regulator [unclassified Frigoribacterium]|uniref:LacI family DNA-binding transcriptional regulator n=1 Tax=unclassified Frigoribacterium TaxID=2627005 RepID=UPI00156678DC|nr:MULTISPECIES: LacI family DNA-binding transcriptional regulator [unclassified Frigoribacterium]NQW88241.1 LacI family DNA-binding transcriptional regulator [Frigoribacterium sp. VKM Ac-2860]NQX08950.1 LacI family DNA-binding transcriptional regulator [Frigoribacterium sp. VKM Ac-2859]